MRKLQTREESEKNRKFKTRIMSITMLLILVSGTLGFAFSFHSGFSNTTNSNPQINNNIPDRITKNYQGTIFNLMSSQSSLENISVDITSTPEIFVGKPLYVDIEDQLILQEISSTLGRISSRVQPACYGVCEENLPERDCSENLIIHLNTNENKVYQQDNCTFISGDLKAADAFINKLFP